MSIEEDKFQEFNQLSSKNN